MKKNRMFPVVGLGASAGGLEALKAFFGKVKKNSGLAYIVNVHLSAKQPSLMPELLQRVSSIPVAEARDKQKLEPDHVYVVPSDKIIEIHDGTTRLFDIPEEHPAMPIDNFLRSLARDQRGAAVAIILSGTGSDGTLGVKEIKVYEGLVLVQSEESAGYNGMPRNAIATGVVDMVLAPEEMAEKLVSYFDHAQLALAPKVNTSEVQQEWLNKVFAVLRTRVGHDFSQYKINTLLRRVSRRMGLNQIIEHDNYLHYLRANPEEVDALFRDLLIGVTSFFRDPESFRILGSTILPKIFNSMGKDDTFRAWIPGCSTGEEVYSLAILIREVLTTNPKQIKVQLFGTDIDTLAIEKAREGVFSTNIAAEVGDERLQHYFIKEGANFRIRKEIRDCAVFSAQDLIKDPPFSRLHLLCCRNLLIYLDTEAQKKLLPLFHYTLIPEGVLVLGSSESIGSFTNLFEPLDKKWKIFRRLEVPMGTRRDITFPSGSGTVEKRITNDMLPAPAAPKIEIGQLTQRVILERFAPTCLLIDKKGLILYVEGRTGKYLETPSGVPTHNVLDMAREGLRIELSSALRAAITDGQTVTRRKIGVRADDGLNLINLHLCPLHMPRELEGRFLVVFEEVKEPVAKEQESREAYPQEEEFRLASLEKELQHTREGHQTAIEELESSNEELKSTNEELQSANEELQSTNEELESSKEELQSLNEELQTVNAELQSKVEELSAAHDDMNNLLNGTEIATIFVDNEIRIRRFTPQATSIINLIQTDNGRPLQHVVCNLEYEGMIRDLREVMKTLHPKEREVQAKDKQWYKMRLMPYRTNDNHIDGAVLTFSSITEQKQVQDKLKLKNIELSQAEHLVRNVLDLTVDPLVVLDRYSRIVLINHPFSELLDVPSETATGKEIYELKKGLLKNNELQQKLQSAVEKGTNFQIDAETMALPEKIGAWSVKGQVIGVDGEENPSPYRILLQFVRESSYGQRQ